MLGNKIKCKIKEKGYKLKFIAEKLDLTPYGLSLKLNGKSDFKWNEVVEISNILNLTEEEKRNFFN